MLSGYKFIIFIGSCEEDLDSTLFTDASLGLDTGPVAVGTGNDSALDRQAMLSIWGVGVSVPGPLPSAQRLELLSNWPFMPVLSLGQGCRSWRSGMAFVLLCSYL